MYLLLCFLLVEFSCGDILVFQLSFLLGKRKGGGVRSFTTQVYLRHEKKTPPTFHYTGWLNGILIMVYYNPYITG